MNSESGLGIIRLCSREFARIAALTLVGLSAGAGTLHTWVGGASGSWTNEANWTDGNVPLTTNDDAWVDGDPALASAAIFTVTNGAAISNGNLTVDLGDAVTLTKEAANGSASFYFDGLLSSAGTFTLGGSGTAVAHGHTLQATFARGAGAELNAAGGLIHAKSLTGYRRNSVTLTVPAAVTNNGAIRVQNVSGQGSGKIRLMLSGAGGPVFVNNGLVSLEGNGGDNGAAGNQPWAAFGSGTAGAGLTLAGTGTVSLASNLNVQPDSFAVLAGLATGTSLTNAAGHTIQGNGYIGLNLADGASGNTISAYRFNILVNQGLIRAIGSASNTWLQIQPSGGAFVNEAGGRLVTLLGTGTVMRIGSHTVATGFTNNGLLEARSGTLVAFGTATTARVNGELRGGGAYVVATNIFLADSATLAPGDSEAADGTGASTVGLLTVTGNVALASATALNFQFGSAVAAGADYDAVAVTGSLTLDGVLNIEERPGFSLSGRYRLFTFRADGASVTDNGLTVPQGYQVLVDRDNGWVDLVYPSRATIMTVR